MHEVGYDVQIRLWPAAARVVVEALLLGEPQQQKLEIVDRGRVGDVPVAGALLQVGVVPGETAGERRLGHLGTPERQQAVALGVGVLQGGALPLVASPGQAHRRHVAVDVDDVEVRHGRVADGLALLRLEFLDVAALRERVDAQDLRGPSGLICPNEIERK